MGLRLSRRPDPAALTGLLVALGETQVHLIRCHQRLQATHPYRSNPLGRPWLKRPVVVYAESCTDVEEQEDDCEVPPATGARIVLLGNPALWWPALLGPHRVTAHG